MSSKFRNYNGTADYKRIVTFLIEHFKPENADGNWLAPAWEYMHGHPALDHSVLEKIGVWEDNGKIIAVAHMESALGEAFFQFHPDYKTIQAELLDYAEHNLYGHSGEKGRKVLSAYISDDNPAFLSLVRARGYTKDDAGARPICKMAIPHAFPAIHLPKGFQLKSLADDCDWVKVNRVLWRGFNHAGEPPASGEDTESRRKMFDTPGARRDLKIIVANPKGQFVAICGMFYEPTHRYAYVEPVATDPDFRRLGLGKAAVLEGIRRCAILGAREAYVGSDQLFYQALGFKKLYTSECWTKFLADPDSMK